MKQYILIFCALLLSQGVQAAIWCTGTINNIYIDSSKNVMIKSSWRGDYTRICKTDGSTGVDTVTCSLWFSLATTSMTNNKNVILMYNDQGGTINCQNIPDGINAPNPQYVMLVK